MKKIKATETGADWTMLSFTKPDSKKLPGGLRSAFPLKDKLEIRKLYFK
ncbi:MAG: hypothetical protein WAM28_01690 [Chlamydiales bacterium]